MQVVTFGESHERPIAKVAPLLLQSSFPEAHNQSCDSRLLLEGRELSGKEREVSESKKFSLDEREDEASSLEKSFGPSSSLSCISAENRANQ